MEHQSYALDMSAAKAADTFFSKIEEKGKYLGVLTRAEPRTSNKGSKGVDMSFITDGGATADYLTIWTYNGEGRQLPGLNVLMAIMTCLRVKNLTAQMGEIEKYDNDTKKREKVQVPLFKDLMSRPIGLILHMEEYAKKAGGTSWKPVISAAFDADGFTASEILSKATAPETLEKILSAVKDRPLKPGAQHAYAPGLQSENPGAGFDDQDIPF